MNKKNLLLSVALILLSAFAFWRFAQSYEIFGISFFEGSPSTSVPLPIQTPTENLESADEPKKTQKVYVRFPENMIVWVQDHSCMEIFFEDQDVPPDIEITKASDLEKCEKQHHQIKTSTPSEAIKSLLDAYRLDDSFAEQGNSNAFEIDDLLRMYAYLIDKKDVEKLELIAKIESDEGLLAKSILKIHYDGLKK